MLPGVEQLPGQRYQGINQEESTLLTVSSVEASFSPGERVFENHQMSSQGQQTSSTKADEESFLMILNEAATRIQAVYRGYSCRKKHHSEMFLVKKMARMQMQMNDMALQLSMCSSFHATIIEILQKELLLNRTPVDKTLTPSSSLQLEATKSKQGVSSNVSLAQSSSLGQTKDFVLSTLPQVLEDKSGVTVKHTLLCSAGLNQFSREKSLTLEEPIEVDSSKSILTVATPPRFARILDVHTSVEAGDPLEFRVLVEGDPLPEICWLINDEAAAAEDCLLTVRSTEKEHLLRIEKCSQFHSGTITCVAQNALGKVISVTYLS